MAEETKKTGPAIENYDLKLFGSMLLPSFLSGFVVVLISILTIGAMIYVSNYEGSSLQNDLFHYQIRNNEDIGIDENYGDISTSLSDNVLIDRAPVMVFWMFVGAIAYFVLTGIIQAFTTASEFEHELDYVHAQRKELLKTLYIKTSIRFGVLVAWFAYIKLFLDYIMPYSLAASRYGGSVILSFTGVMYTLLGLLVLIVGLHMHIILVRLVALRPRIFSQESSF